MSHQTTFPVPPTPPRPRERVEIKVTALITYTDEETRKMAIEWATGYAKEAVDGIGWTAPEGYTITFNP